MKTNTLTSRYPELPPRHFCFSYSGRKIGPENELPSDLDIAISLGRVCRFNGHTKRFYSNLLHTLVVADLLPYPLHAYGLLHDAPEVISGDHPKPFKSEEIEQIEFACFLRMCAHYQIPEPPALVLEAIKMADNTALFGENWTVAPPGIRELYGRNALAERLARHYLKRFRPQDGFSPRGKAVEYFLFRLRTALEKCRAAGLAGVLEAARSVVGTRD